MSEPSTLKKTLSSQSDTSSLAKDLAQALKGGELLALEGDLGAGKTTFTRELTQELGCTRLAKSPTFAIFNTYPGGRLSVLHGDFYRLLDARELEDIGWQEMLEPNEQRIMVIEWANKFPKLLPTDYLRLIWTLGEGENERELQIVATGPKSQLLLERLER